MSGQQDFGEKKLFCEDDAILSECTMKWVEEKDKEGQEEKEEEDEDWEEEEEEVEDYKKKKNCFFFLSIYIVISKEFQNCMSLIQTTYKTTLCVFIVTKLYSIIAQFLIKE